MKIDSLVFCQALGLSIVLAKGEWGKGVAEESWNAARLIPTSGINGADEQERRATSALLAVLSAVRELGRTLLAPLGAPAGTVEAYIEVPFQLQDRTFFPDGLIRVTRGRRSWTALLEVKTGTNELRADQLETYLDIAKERDFDAVLTISNEIPAVPGQHPTLVNRRKLKSVPLYHVTWIEILTAAVMQKEYRGVEDPEQAWILGELIRYLEHPRSGAMEFSDMGPHWTQVRDSVRTGTLRAGDKGVREVTTRFDALLRFVGLKLGQKLGSDVQPVLSRRVLAAPQERTQELVHSLVTEGKLSGTMRIPGAAAQLLLTVDLRAQQVCCAARLEAPRQGRARTRVNWLLRQLGHAPESLNVEALCLRGRGAGLAEPLGTVRGDPEVLIADPTRELRAFRLTQVTPMGLKRASGRGGFVDSVICAVDSFYVDVLQHLKTWSEPAPRLRPVPEGPDVPVALISTALSSQDEPDRGDRDYESHPHRSVPVTRI